MIYREVNDLFENYAIKFNSFSSILCQYPLNQCAELLYKFPRVSSYSYRSKELNKFIYEIRRSSNESLSQLYNQLLLIFLIRDNIIKLDSSELPPNIKSLYHANFNRILDYISLNKEPLDFYVFSNDKFLKDLAVCAQRLIPAGFAKAHLAKFPLTSFLRHGMFQFIEILYYITFELGGVTPLYELHIDSHDPELMKEMNAEGLKRFFINMADLMKNNLDVKGMFGIAWFLDPSLTSISPRLQYIHQSIINSDGNIFRMGMSDHSIKDALAKSQTRKKLYSEGKYSPKNHMSVWSRKKLIHWAEMTCTLSE